MYTSITSGHSKEYATLQFEVHGNQLPPFQVRRLNVPNCITITDWGDAKYIALSDYKMSKFCGCNHIVLGSDSPLLQHLGRHLQLYRHYGTKHPPKEDQSKSPPLGSVLFQRKEGELSIEKMPPQQLHTQTTALPLMEAKHSILPLPCISCTCNLKGEWDRHLATISGSSWL